jgi:hypothetical protein
MEYVVDLDEVMTRVEEKSDEEKAAPTYAAKMEEGIMRLKKIILINPTIKHLCP